MSTGVRQISRREAGCFVIAGNRRRSPRRRDSGPVPVPVSVGHMPEQGVCVTVLLYVRISIQPRGTHNVTYYGAS